jgi:hypothetical protein
MPNTHVAFGAFLALAAVSGLPASRLGSNRAGANAASAKAGPAAGSLAVEISFHPAGTLSPSDLQEFQIDFVVTNTSGATMNPQLGRSVLRMNGAPVPNWDVTINNGPRDDRWEALPAGDRLQFGYRFGDSLFSAAGDYAFVLEVGDDRSAPATVHVVTP